MNSNPEKEGKILQWLKTHASEAVKKRNHLDDDLYMQLTPMMKRMFTEGTDRCRMPDFDSGENITFTRVAHDGIPYRKITEEEYNALPEKYKRISNLWLRALGDCIVQLILTVIATVLLVISHFSGDSTTTLALMAFFLVTAAIFFFTYIVTYTSRKDFLIPPDARICFGNVIMLTDEIESSPDIHTLKYLVGVAFYDESSYVLEIECGEATFDRLELDSKVLVYNDFVYAI